MNTQQIIILLFGVLLLGVFTFLPRWQARRRRQKQVSNLRVGDEIMTIGGVVGTLTALDVESNRAQIEIAPGVIVQIVLEGISHAITPSETAE